MALYHAYSQTVADGTATSLVRPSNWNSAHNQIVTLSGNTSGQSLVSGTNIIFQGGSNITLSGVTGASAATIVINGETGGGGGGGAMYFSAGTTSTSANTMPFSNSNGVSFAISGGAVVGSVFTGYVNTSASSLFQQTSATSAITSNAFPSANSTNLINTSASSLFQQTSATSAITSNAFPTANSTNLVNTSASSLFQQTSATSAITSNALNTSQSSLFTAPVFSIYSAGFNGVSVTALPGQSSLYLNYMQLDANVNFCRMDNMVSLGIAATVSFTTSTGTTSGSASAVNVNSYTVGRSYAFYSLGTGTNSTRLESLAGSTTASMGATRGYTYSISNNSNSVTQGATNGFTIAAIRNINSTGGVTYTTLGYSTTASNTASSAADITTTTGTTSIANVSTSLHSGYRIFPVAWSSSLPKNNIWMGFIQASSSTSSGTVSTVMSLFQYFNTNGATSFGHITNTASNTTSNWWPGQGVYTAATAAFPATIGFAQVNPNSLANVPALYMNITL